MNDLLSERILNEWRRLAPLRNTGRFLSAKFNWVWRESQKPYPEQPMMKLRSQYRTTKRFTRRMMPHTKLKQEQQEE